MVEVEAAAAEMATRFRLAKTVSTIKSRRASLSYSSWSSVAKPRPLAVEIRLKDSSVGAGIALGIPGVAPRVVMYGILSQLFTGPWSVVSRTRLKRSDSDIVFPPPIPSFQLTPEPDDAFRVSVCNT